ncbi:MAG TPA: biopolymer transporter ExbD [Planctomycetota bacterium]|mgnify:CR=1 FL=1|nr:biopolymer transporter ExbD [Planctomycetota bacterium]HRT95951.1 biopolymer transporter ExbD [Planctomycetota bacterium]
MIRGASRRIMLTKLNMTPMIDCVFLLNLFFMTVTELTRQDDIEAILLPDIKQAIPDENPDPERLVINVLKDGTMIIGGNECSDQQVEDALLVESRLTRNAEGISDRTVLVKADERTPFKHIRRLMTMCVKRNIRIWRISFGVKPQEMTAGE